jgi:uncharacterized flavoprotein (TIGR03862 family)
MGSEKYDVLVVGGGPAGLRAAELASAAGFRTVLADHKPSVGRKFLVAGRGGLNLTHSEPVENFPAHYGDTDGGSAERWQKLLAGFSPDALRAWAEGLGLETFIGTSGRVFPLTKQAAPLLRRWIERLRKQGVSFRLRHSLVGFRKIGDEWEVGFTTPHGAVTLRARAVILALGGASWPQTGSDGGWVKLFADMGIAVTPLAPANCGYEVAWPPEFLEQAEGLPLKNVVVRAGDESVAGELLITKYGIEGGAIYQVGPALRTMSQLKIEIDLKPTFTAKQLEDKLEYLMAVGDSKDARPSPLGFAVQAWRLSKVAHALLHVRAQFGSTRELAALAKAYPLTLRGPRPIEEAISTAGGVSWEELDDDLMLKRCPGIFCAGEMIDWDAPTGGYLIQGCFSTATRAVRGALGFLTELRN